MKKLKYATAAVTAHAANGVVIAMVGGIVTASVATKIIAGSAGWAPRRLAQVVSYADARVELSAEDLFAAAVRAAPGPTPTALVVSDEQLAMFAAYSQMHADRGVMKAAFTGIEAAQRWAADQARVMESWGLWRRALAASP